VTSSNTNALSNHQGQQQGQTQSNSNSAVGSGNVTEFNSRSEVNAQPAIAPDLAGLVGSQCMGSVTASGAGGGIVSIGFGTTYVDHDCELRAFAASLLAVGERQAAISILMDNKEVKNAIIAAHPEFYGAKH